jgi:hypothetical protein
LQLKEVRKGGRRTSAAFSVIGAPVVPETIEPPNAA